MVDLHGSIAMDLLDLHISRTRRTRVGAGLAIASRQEKDGNEQQCKDER
jgi:hypothetical protein